MEETKEKKIESCFNKLSSNLEELTKSYRTLLDLLRHEKDYLVASDVAKLAESNQLKETCLYKLRSLDAARERYARDLAGLVGADVAAPRLLEIAAKTPGPVGDRLRLMHSTLELIVRRTHEINQENEQYTKSALTTLNGAMVQLKDTLAPKKVYGRNAKMSEGTEGAGNFSSKEA